MHLLKLFCIELYSNPSPNTHIFVRPPHLYPHLSCISPSSPKKNDGRLNEPRDLSGAVRHQLCHCIPTNPQPSSHLHRLLSSAFLLHSATFQSMYVRVKRASTTYFCPCDPSQSGVELKASVADLIGKDPDSFQFWITASGSDVLLQEGKTLGEQRVRKRRTQYICQYLGD